MATVTKATLTSLLIILAVGLPGLASSGNSFGAPTTSQTVRVPAAKLSSQSPSAETPTQALRPQESIYDRNYVDTAKITAVQPLPLKVHSTLMIDLEVTLARPVSSARILAGEMLILLDGTPLPAVEAPRVTNLSQGDVQTWQQFTEAEKQPLGSSTSTSSASSAERSSSSSTTTSAIAFSPNIRITVFAATPDFLPSGRSLPLTVFSKLDGRNIAQTTVETPASNPLLSWQAWLGYVLAVVLPAVVVQLWRQSQRRIRTLEQEVSAERKRVGELVGGGFQRAPTNEPVRESKTQAAAIVVPDTLTNALIHSDLTVVLGVGASMQAGLPTGASLWLAVLGQLRSEIPASKWTAMRAALMDAGADAVIEPLLSAVPRQRVLQALASELPKDRTTPKELHRGLATLAQMGVRAFVDLTWDSLMQSALGSARVFAGPPFKSVAESFRSGQLTLIKPAGTLTEPETVALTQQEFRGTLAHSPELERCLASLFSTQTLLFVGVGTRGIEKFVSALPPDLQSSGREHLAVLPVNSSVELWADGFAKRFGISVLQLPEETYLQSLPRFVDELIAAARARQPSRREKDQTTDKLPGIGKLRTLELHNIGNFKSLQIEFKENWTLLLGDNGGGKSTILRAISLALAGNDPRAEGMAARLLRTDEESGFIELTLGSPSVTRVRTSLVRDGTRVQIKSPQTTPLQAGLGLILGFPALRGVTTTQLTGPTRMDALDPSVDDIAPLLQEKLDTRLNQLKQWVINAALESEDNPQGRSARMFQTFKDVVRDIVPGRHVAFKRVDRRQWTVVLATDDGDVSFDALSQGTSSILAWVGILLQRLYDIYPEADAPERQMALVLVDEIDAHLHPRWQRKLVTLTRGKFPNVQVIASSHSPLLAGCMHRTELLIVERDINTGLMQAKRPREELSGRKADDILTSSLFALPTSRSVDAEEKIKEYFSLFEKYDRSEVEDERLHQLEQDLEQLNYGATASIREQQEDSRTQLLQSIDTLDTDQAALLSARLSGKNPRT